MKLIFTFLTFFASIVSLYSNDICNLAIPDTLKFGDIEFRGFKTEEISLQNTGNEDVMIYDIKINSQFRDYIEIEDINFPIIIPPNETVKIKITLHGKQDVFFNGMLFFQIGCGKFLYSKSVYVNAFIEVYKNGKRLSIGYNKWGKELLNEFKIVMNYHTSFSYKEARKLFWGSFDRRDSLVECIYTGKTINPGYDPDFAALDALGFNTEHTWPRSLGAEQPPAESDINHLFVSDKTANDKRANYPFGFVTNGVTFEDGGSKLGKNDAGETVFEVRDKYKGNVARALFYFAVRYDNPNAFLDGQEDDLRQWAEIDPVDGDELARNDSILKYQKRSNLFVEYPEMLDRIPSISKKSDVEYQPNYFVSDTGIVFDLSKFADTARVRFWITNYSNKVGETEILFYIYDIGFNGDDNIFSIEHQSEQMYISSDRNKYIDVICKNLKRNGFLEIFLNYLDGHQELITAYAVNAVTDVINSNNSEYSVKNYPNPASGSTRIILDGISNLDDIISVKVYDMVSGELADLTKSIAMSEGSASVDFSPNLSMISGQVYFVRFELKGKSIIHPIVFMN